MIKIIGDIPDDVAVDLIEKFARQDYLVVAKRGEDDLIGMPGYKYPEKWDIAAKKRYQADKNRGPDS